MEPITKSLAFASILFLLISEPVFPGSTRMPFTPGRIGLTNPPLSDFVGKNLQAACIELEEKNYAPARKAFQTAVNQDPTDIGAWIGLAQSSPDDWQQMFNAYQAQDKTYPSPVNDFKAGLLADYLLGATPVPKVMPSARLNDLRQTAFVKLLSAFNQTQDPVAAFVFESSLPQDGYFPDSYTPALDKLLMRYAGKTRYNEYLKAKASNWSSPVPDVPSLSEHDLKVLYWTVRKIWVFNGTIVVKNVEVPGSHGAKFTGVDVPYGAEQTRAMDWLQIWQDNIKARIVAAGGHISPSAAI